MLRSLVAIAAVCGQLFEPIKAQSLPETQTAGTIQVFISDDCKSSFYGYFLSGADARKRPSYVPWSTFNAKAMVFKDPRNRSRSTLKVTADTSRPSTGTSTAVGSEIPTRTHVSARIEPQGQ